MDALVQDLVDANHILAGEGVLDAFGHVSARHPTNEHLFLIARSRSPALVQADDVQVYDLDGRLVGGAEGKGYAERFIHAEVYRSRSDVHSVCHSHAPSVVAFGVGDVALRPMWHTAAIIGADIPVWDIASEFGPTDLLVRTAEQGRALADHLGGRAAMLMRGHGSVCVGHDVREAVQVAHGLECNAIVQQRALAMSDKVNYLSDDEVDQCSAMLREGLVKDRMWEYWRARAAGRAESVAPRTDGATPEEAP